MADCYVSALAAGGGTGAVGSPYTLAEAIAAINAGTALSANGDTCWVKADGTYNTSGFTVTGAGTYDAFKKIKGYTSSTTDNGIASILATGGTAAYIFYVTGAYWDVRNITVDGNSKTYGTTGLFRMSAGNHRLSNCYAKNGKAGGFIACFVYHCTATGNGGVGFGDCHGSYNYAGANTGIGFDQSDSSLSYFCCIAKGNVGNNYRVTGRVYNCISDGTGGGDGFYMTRAGTVMNGVAINHGAGKYGVNFYYNTAQPVNVTEGMVFYNNTNDCNQITAIDSYTIVNPGFTDTAALDYTRTSTALDGLGHQFIGQTGTPAVTNYGIPSGVGGSFPFAAIVAPTFAGISQLEAVGGGCLRVVWVAATGHTGYSLYIKDTNATDLFTDTYKVAELQTTLTEYFLRTEADGKTFLQNTKTYYVGVRADNSSVQDANDISLSAIIVGDGATYIKTPTMGLII